MFEGYLLWYNNVPYFSPLVVICLCLLSSWMPGILRGLYRIFYPVLRSLSAIIRRFI